MAFTKVVGAGIHTLSNITSHNINSSGIITATAFDGPFTGGSSSNITAGIITATELDLNGNVDISGNLTVNGDTTTLNTTLREVELLRVDADASVAAGIITQKGSGDILSVYDTSTEVFKIADGGVLSINGRGNITNNPSTDHGLGISNNASQAFSTSEHIEGTTNRKITPLMLRNQSTSGNTETYLGFDAGHSSKAQWNIGVKKTGALQGDFIFNTRTGSSTSAERLRITSAGNLAINKTSAISAKLHIGDASNNGALSQLIKLGNDSSGAGTGSQINLGAGHGNESTAACIGGFLDSAGGTSFIVKTAGTYANQSTVDERLRIKSDGNITFGIQSSGTAVTSGNIKHFSLGKDYWNGDKGHHNALRLIIYDGGANDAYGLGISNGELEIQAQSNIGFYAGSAAGNSKRDRRFYIDLSGDVIFGYNNSGSANSSALFNMSLGGTYHDTNGAYPKLSLWHDGTDHMGFGVSGNQLDYILTSASYDHVFYGGNAGTTELLRIKGGTGKVGIGVTNPNNPLTIHGSGNHIYLKDTATNNVLQIRHSGGVAEFNSFDLDGSARRDFVFNQYATEVLRIDGSGRMGLGVSPTGIFDIRQDNNPQLTLRSASHADDGGGRLNFAVGVSAAPQDGNTMCSIASTIHSTSGGTLKGDMKFYTNQGDDLEERMVIKSDGQLIHNAENSSGHVAEFNQTHASNDARILINSPTDNNIRPAFIQLSNAGTAKWGVGQVYASTSSGAFHLLAGNNQESNSKFVVTTAGRVGIGTINPDTKLHVAGSGNESISLKLEPGTTAGNYSELVIGRTSSAPAIQTTPVVKGGVPVSGVPGILFGSENTNLPAIGFQTPNSSNGHIVFKPKGSEKVRISSDGDVLFKGEVSIGDGAGDGKTLTLYGSSSSSFRISKSGVLAYDHTFDGSEYTIANNNGSAGIPIVFGTKTAGAESLRIDAAGNMSLGRGANASTNYGRNFHIHDTGTSGATLHLTTSSTGTSNSDGFHLVQQGVHLYHWLREEGDQVFATTALERLRIRSKGGVRFQCAENYTAANLGECDTNLLALNLKPVRSSVTKAMAFGSIGGGQMTSIQGYDTSDDSANSLALNPLGGSVGVNVNGTPSADFEVGGSGDISHTKMGWARRRTFSISINSSETRYYKIVNYQAGNMLVGRLEIYTARNSGYNQTKGYNEWRFSYGGYNNSIYGTGAENTNFYAGTAASVDIVFGTDGGTGENIYIKMPSSVYGGAAFFILEGMMANWQFDASVYLTSAP